ncbi:hypothetical protein EJB05_29161, partial [Eragrostis curvula]
MESKVRSSRWPGVWPTPAFMGLIEQLDDTVTLSIRIDQLQPAGVTSDNTTPDMDHPLRMERGLHRDGQKGKVGESATTCPVKQVEMEGDGGAMAGANVETWINLWVDTRHALPCLPALPRLPCLTGAPATRRPATQRHLATHRHPGDPAPAALPRAAPHVPALLPRHKKEDGIDAFLGTHVDEIRAVPFMSQYHNVLSCYSYRDNMDCDALSRPLLKCNMRCC